MQFVRFFLWGHGGGTVVRQAVGRVRAGLRGHSLVYRDHEAVRCLQIARIQVVAVTPAAADEGAGDVLHILAPEIAGRAGMDVEFLKIGGVLEISDILFVDLPDAAASCQQYRGRRGIDIAIGDQTWYNEGRTK